MSKQLLNQINESGIDVYSLLSIQLVCIDNDNIRTRILQNKDIDIKSVPCLLIVYPDGGVEKYEVPHIFEWFEQVIKRYAPPPPPPEPQTPPPPPPPEPKPSPKKVQKKKNRNEINKREYERYKRNQMAQKEEIPERMEEDPNEFTAISDLQSEEENEDESNEEYESRYKTPQPKARLRQNDGNYSNEDEELFQGEVPDMRNAVGNSIKKSENKPQDIMARARELEKGRETIETRKSN